MNWKDCSDRADKWNWHAEVYAHRRVFLNAPLDEQTSPADPTGEWFNEELVRRAAERLQAKRRRPQPSDGGFFTDPELAERAEYARLNGYPNWAQFLDALHEGSAKIMDFVAWAQGQRHANGPPVSGSFVRLGTALPRHNPLQNHLTEPQSVVISETKDGELCPQQTSEAA